VIGAPAITTPGLRRSGVAHGFFGRAGGVSTGIFSTLNAGRHAGDDPNAVGENRARCAATLGVPPERILTLRQVHSPKALIVEAPWTGAGPEADAMATRLEGVALGVLAADCMPFLFVDPDARVIGCAHAGWRGALAGVLDAAIEAMGRLGASPPRIRAALGPCLRQENFEVGPEVPEAFAAKYPDAERFFAAGPTPEKRRLDLAGFARSRLAVLGVEQVEDVEICTLGRADAYFSNRANRRAGEERYGRNLSAIALTRGLDGGAGTGQKPRGEGAPP
jgi:hypothetical protein